MVLSPVTGLGAGASPSTAVKETVLILCKDQADVKGIKRNAHLHECPQGWQLLIGNFPQGSLWPNREGDKWEFSQVVSELSVSPVTQSSNAKCFVKNRFLW